MRWRAHVVIGGMLALSVAMLTSASWSVAATESVLYSFQGGADGATPFAGLVMDKSGNLYGTTSAGGGSSACTGGCGTVFELTPPATSGGVWTETLIHSFDNIDGSDLSGSLLLRPDGGLFGTAGLGGTGGHGTVFHLAPPTTVGGVWSLRTLHSFGTYPHLGENPLTGLLAGASGALYGTTLFGSDQGSNVSGTVFELTPPTSGSGPWSESVLYSFLQGGDEFPEGALIADANGNLYGVAQEAFGSEIAFMYILAPPSTPGGTWTETSVTTPPGPVGKLLAGKSGILYGGGSNEVFEMIPPATSGGMWTNSTLYTFSILDGTGTAGVVADGNGDLYGGTDRGNTGNGGAVYQLVPPSVSGGAWTENVLYVFPGPAALDDFPVGELILDQKSRALYGVTQGGGAAGLGAVFSVTL